MEAKRTTLREFIDELQELSENGKYDDLRVVIMDYEDECRDVGWYGIGDVYPDEEATEDWEKCFIIQI